MASQKLVALQLCDLMRFEVETLSRCVLCVAALCHYVSGKGYVGPSCVQR